MADPKVQSFQELQAENAALKAELEKLKTGKRPGPIPPDSGEFVSSKPYYASGRYYSPGEIITLVNFPPGRDMVKVTKSTSTTQKASQPPAPSGRPSDRSVT